MIAQTQTITIKIQRAGHFYYYTRTWNGDVKHEPITRERAETVIRAQNNGAIPNGVNLDVCHPRSWTWEKELEEA